MMQFDAPAHHGSPRKHHPPCRKLKMVGCSLTRQRAAYRWRSKLISAHQPSKFGHSVISMCGSRLYGVAPPGTRNLHRHLVRAYIHIYAIIHDICDIYVPHRHAYESSVAVSCQCLYWTAGSCRYYYLVLRQARLLPHAKFDRRYVKFNTQVLNDSVATCLGKFQKR